MNATPLLILIVTLTQRSTYSDILTTKQNNFTNKIQQPIFQIPDAPNFSRKDSKFRNLDDFILLLSTFQYSRKPCYINCERFNALLYEKINETNTNSSSILSKELELKMLEADSVAMQEFLTNYQTSKDTRSCNNDTKCVLFGDCCPDRDKYLLDETYNYYSCNTIPMSDGSTVDYLLISKCPPFVKNDDIDTKSLCEREFNLKYPPVISNGVDRIYRNEFCAKCNGVFTFIKWEADIVVENEDWYDRIIHIRNLSDVQDLMRLYSQNTVFKIPEGMPKPWMCPNHYRYIDYCNVTGRMSDFAPWEKVGCLSYTDPVSIFRNIYCKKCNLDIFCDECPGFSKDGFSFGALMDIELLQKYENYMNIKDEKKICGNDEFYDYPNERCRHIYCSPGLFLTPNLNCSFIFTSAGNIHYKIHFSLIPQIDITEETLFDAFSVHKKILIWDASLVTLKYKFNNQQLLSYVEKILFYFHFTCAKSTKFSEMEEKIKTWFFKIKRSPFLGLFRIVKDFESIEFSENYLLTQQYNKSLYKPYLFKKFSIVEKAILYSDIRECPKVKLGYQEFIRNGDNLVTLVSGRQVNLIMDRVEINSNGSIMICLSDYPGTSPNLDLPTPDLAEIILSKVFIGISVFCLAITLTTYTVFSELRTLPGICNIFLCSTLFTSQALLLFNVPDNELACTITGLIRHFAWLSTFGWMSICSFHMYRVFTRLLRCNDLKPSKTILKYTLAAYGLPFLVVVGTVIANMTMYGVRFTGYGLPNCYLNRKNQLIVTFALPLSLMIIFNTSLLSTTIYSLYKTSKECKIVNRDKRRVIVYLKLSTLTGITWIFGLLSMSYPNIWVKYIFIVTNASQGIYIFLSYTLNTKILKLYAFKFSRLCNTNVSSIYTTETTSTT